MAFKQNLPFKLPFSTLPNVELSKRPNKIVYGDDVLIDLTSDTVSEANVLKDVTFHKADGTSAIGTYTGSGGIDVSASTVTPETILEGYKAYNSNGGFITGTYSPPVLKYVELDYIQSNGVVLTDLPVYAKSTIKTQIKFMYTRYSGYTFFGYHGSTDESGSEYRFFVANGMWYLDLNKKSIGRINGGSCSTTTIYEFEIGNRYVKDMQTGSNVISGTAVTSFSSTNKLKVFDASGEYGRIYYIKCYDGSDLVCDLIPAIKVGTNSIGLYDKVGDGFYTVSGLTYGTIVGAIY